MNDRTKLLRDAVRAEKTLYWLISCAHRLQRSRLAALEEDAQTIKNHGWDSGMDTAALETTEACRQRFRLACGELSHASSELYKLTVWSNR